MLNFKAEDTGGRRNRHYCKKIAVILIILFMSITGVLPGKQQDALAALQWWSVNPLENNTTRSVRGSGPPPGRQGDGLYVRHTDGR